MQFIQTKIDGAFLIEPERLADERGFFARTWCQQEFEAHGLESRLVQCSVSFSPRQFTLRGLHYQAEPHGETKLVRCTQGAIYDVVVDLRPTSPTRMAWDAYELTAENRRALSIPRGVAHGFLTLAENCEVFYQMSEFFHSPSARGVRWNDPAFGIEWPRSPAVISDRDASYDLWAAPGGGNFAP